MRKTIFLILIFYLFPGPGQAQNSHLPFENITLFLGGEQNINREDLHRFWKPEISPTIALQTPFYIGTAAFKVGLTPFHRKTTRINFNLIYYALNWEFPLVKFLGITFSPGFHFGSAAFQFVNPQPPLQKEVAESEIAAGPLLAAQYQLSPQLSVRAYLDKRYIFSHKRIGLTYLGLQAGYQFSTPGWIREILE